MTPSGAARVLALVTDAYGGHGGISRFNRDLLGALAAESCSEVVVFPRLAALPITEEIPARVRFVARGLDSKVGYIRNLFTWLARDRRFDLVVCGHINLLPAAWLLTRLLGCPLVMIIHGIDAWQPTPSRLANRLTRRVDGVLSVSRITFERFRHWSGVAPERLFLLPNCVDLSAFTPGPKNPRLLKRYGLDGRDVLLTLGRMPGPDRYKGFDEVLEVLPRLLKERPDLVYMLAGDGPDRARLEKKAADLGVSGRVVFTGMVAEEEKAEHYRLADAYVMPSRGEGFGIVLLEAMSCGVPVLASCLDGSREALRDGLLGTLVDPGKPEEIIAGILRALQAPRQVPAGLDYFSSRNFHQRVKELLDLYFENGSAHRC